MQYVDSANIRQTVCFVPIFKKFFYVSHQPERKEKDCLNCRTDVVGRFCHRCGQENIVTHQSFWSLTKHFVYDILHFDGKFFHTIGYIFSRPGFVARQYAEGKRMSYLDPIRMYLFTSAIFFLVFFSVNKFDLTKGTSSGWLDNEDRRDLAEEYRERLRNDSLDTVWKSRINLLLDTARPINIDSLGWRENFTIVGGGQYSSLSEYDSLQAALPEDKRDSWLERALSRQSLKVSKKYGNSENLGSIFLEAFLHRLPYLLFVSLPFFALILKLLYGRRKNFFYSDHAVFTLYHYIFSFILLLLIFGVAALRSWSGWGIFTFLMVMLILAWPVYLYIEMKRFYRQGRAKTLGKFLLLNVTGLTVLVLLFILFFVFSVFQL